LRWWQIFHHRRIAIPLSGYLPRLRQLALVLQKAHGARVFACSFARAREQFAYVFFGVFWVSDISKLDCGLERRGAATFRVRHPSNTKRLDQIEPPVVISRIGHKRFAPVLSETSVQLSPTRHPKDFNVILSKAMAIPAVPRMKIRPSQSRSNRGNGRKVHRTIGGNQSRS